ncbi:MULTISPECIES: hypothetical protein [Streptomyces]|uniref:hypothetical protein n=1 Tax=Streptomyces TaxID=1883 RepID=UPI0036FF651F
MIPAAALAVIRAELEDATAAELLNRPASTAKRIASALDAHGWAMTAHERTNGPESTAQDH